MNVHVEHLDYELKTNAMSVNTAPDSGDLVSTKTQCDLLERLLERIRAAAINASFLNNTIESLDSKLTIIHPIFERGPNTVN